MDQVGMDKGGTGTAVGGATAVAQPDLISLLAFRQRAIRYWLAAIGLVAFGAAYAGPIALAIRQPSVSEPTVLPELDLPQIAFPHFAVPALHPARAVPAIPLTAPAPARTVRHRVVHRKVEHTKRRAATAQRTRVVH